MKPQQKMKERIELCAKGVIDALKAHEKKNPGECIVKAKLFPFASRRVEWLMEDDYDPKYDEEAFGIPSTKFFVNHWQDICLQAAEMGHYIVSEQRIGVRLGTFDEYQSMRPLMTIIAEGIAKGIDKRSNVIVKQGGVPYSIELQVKQLTSGLE